jgi:manganese transport protein
MCLDAWASMIVFTIATVAFYALGATVLHRQGLIPKEGKMIETLSQMYVGVFGTWTTMAFLIGAWAVLFKTLYVATASNSRLTADFLNLAGFVRYDGSDARRRMIRIFCVIFPLVALAEYLWMGDPTFMVLIGGVAQASTLPIISGATLYLRYRRTDPRLAGSRTQDVLLWLAAASMSVVAIYFIWTKLQPFLVDAS